MAAWIRPPRTAGSTGPVLVAEAVAEVGTGTGGAVVHAPAPEGVRERARSLGLTPAAFTDELTTRMTRVRWAWSQVLG